MGIADDWVRLAMALIIIAMVSFGMYQFGAGAHTVDATFARIDAPL